jgi:hypothetical protein
MINPYRFSPESDVFVYENGQGDLICHLCSMIKEKFFKAKDAETMLAHLEEHIDDNDKVPDALIEELKEIISLKNEG